MCLVLLVLFVLLVVGCGVLVVAVLGFGLVANFVVWVGFAVVVDVLLVTVFPDGLVGFFCVFCCLIVILSLLCSCLLLGWVFVFVFCGLIVDSCLFRCFACF